MSGLPPASSRSQCLRGRSQHHGAVRLANAFLKKIGNRAHTVAFHFIASRAVVLFDMQCR